MNFSKSLSTIQLSPIVKISELAKGRAAEFTRETGEPFVFFQRGEIDFPTPAYIIDAAKKAMDQGFTKYPKSGGEPGFKEAIISKMERYNRATDLSPEQILCTYGGQEALQLAFKLFEGKKGAGFAPCWSCVLENFVPYSDIDFAEVPLNTDFSVDYEILEATIKEVSFFYLNTPQNPTGKVFTEEEITRIVDLCEKYGVYLISDEAYERIVFDGIDYFSPSSLNKDFIISCFTLSKTYAMTGWRLGYLVCRDPKIIHMLRLGDYSQTAGVVTFLQHAGAEAITNVEAEKAYLDQVLAEYQYRRDLLYKELIALEGIEVTKPQGAFYFFPRVSQWVPAGETQEHGEYVFEALLKLGVAVVYGSSFGEYFKDNIRISYSCTDETLIRLALDRMKKQALQVVAAKI